MTEPIAVKVRPGFATGLAPDDWGLLFACFAFSQAIGLITYWTLPLYAGALMSGLSLSATDVGLLGTIEFAGLLLTSSLLAPFIDRGFRRQAAWISAATVVAINLVCGLLPLDLQSLSMLRFVAGLGSGVALTIGNASIANGANPEKLSGQLTFLLVLFMMVAMPAFAWVSEHFGYRGVFLALAATVLIGALSTPFVPRRPNDDPGLELGLGGGAGRHPLLTLAGAMLMLVAFLFGLRDTLPWLVTEQIATEAGLTIQQLGTLLAVMYGISALGPVAQILLARALSAKALLTASMVGAGAQCRPIAVATRRRALRSRRRSSRCRRSARRCSSSPAVRSPSPRARHRRASPSAS